MHAAAVLVAALYLKGARVQSQPETGASAQSAATHAGSGVLTLHVTTREVILDVIALHSQGEPVADLAPGDLQVSYSAEPGSKQRHRRRLGAESASVTSLRAVDPNLPAASAADTRAGFQITASCLARSTPHYELAFRPGADGWTSGYHSISVTTTRSGIRLFYRHRYFVGVTEAPPNPPVAGADSIEKLLRQDACYYPNTPLSISLRARLVDTGRSDVLRYQVAVDAASLTYLTVGSGAGELAPQEPMSREPMSIDRRVQIDYGVCTFNAAGRPIGFFQAPVDQVLTSADYARALAHGFPHILEFQASASIALTRFVVRDRATGNLGATDVAFSSPALNTATDPPANHVSDPGDSAAISQLTRETTDDLELFAGLSTGVYVPPPSGPIGSFGSVVPAANSFCGDVYELEVPSSHLPDFRELDPIGSLYTSTLDVPSQVFTNTDGIPGVTPRTNLFGIDYHAVFWIRNSGYYGFRMVSDDGAAVWIDDRRLIDLDWLHSAYGREGWIRLEPGPHAMHIPYYQGAVTSVALVLWVKAPGGKNWQIFDLHDYAPPSDAKH